MALYLNILLLTVFVSESKCGCLPDLQNLRTFSAYGHAGYFDISAEDFQYEVERRVEKSGWAGVNLFPRDEGKTEFAIYLSNVDDITLRDSDYKPNRYREISITLPVKVGAVDAIDGELQLGHFTVTEDTLNPFLVNYTRTVLLKQLTITEEANSVTWSIKDDSGELEIGVERTAGPRDLRYALRKRSADETYNVKTDFSSTFDWGCDKIPNKPQFCSVLSEHSSEIEAAGMHISNVNIARPGEDSDDAVMEIKKVTGSFKKILPFAQEHQKSMFAFSGSTHETVGIAYYCINQD